MISTSTEKKPSRVMINYHPTGLLPPQSKYSFRKLNKILEHVLTGYHENISIRIRNNPEVQNVIKHKCYTVPMKASRE